MKILIAGALGYMGREVAAQAKASGIEVACGVDVVPGMQNDQFAEILSGLKEGDTVYYTKQENIFAYFASMMGGGMPSGGGMPGGMGPGSQNKRGG